MSDEADMAEGQLPLEGVGQRLKRAREEADMSIKQVADETRIPIRHLEVIETGNFSALPARTYAIGFSRTYAKAVGLDQGEVAEQVRAELGGTRHDQAQRAERFEPGDPARVPSRRLAWFSAFAVVLLIIGGIAFFRPYFFPGSGPSPLIDPTELAAADENIEVAEPAENEAAPAPSGRVVFTSLNEGVWVRFYDGNGERLMEKQMARGERYLVPGDADNPQIRTGQPEALAISIGGESIGNLSNRSEIVSDISVTAEALIVRSVELEAEARSESAEADGNASSQVG